MSEMVYRLLMVTRDFAPMGAVGVERVIKYAKYLRHYGWEPTVLTGSKSSHGFRQDLELAKDVEDIVTLKCVAPDLFSLASKFTGLFKRQEDNSASYEKRLYKPRGPWHPKSLVIPDSQVLWTLPALYTALLNARRFKWDVVYATLSPPTNMVVGYLIAKSLRLPLLIDYRDPWTDAFFSPNRLKPLAWLERKLEATMFSAASAITALDPVCLQTPLREARCIPPIKIIPNGYDEDDFDCEPKKLPRNSIVHTGNLHADRSLADAWATMKETLLLEPSLKGNLHFWQLGTVDEYVMNQLENPPEGLQVHYLPPVPMQEAIQYMLGANMLIVMSYESGGKLQNTPAKIYQYLRANRPILALCDEEAQGLRDTAQDANNSCCCPSKDHRTAAEYVVRQIASDQEPRPSIGPNIQKYSRHDQTRQLAEMLITALRAS
jgi:glycosyltransferase involved in cell wall biosynthesis